MKVRVDSWQNNKKATVLQFKTDDLLNFVKNYYYFFSPQGHLSVFFCQKLNNLEPNYYS